MRSFFSTINSRSLSAKLLIAAFAIALTGCGGGGGGGGTTTATTTGTTAGSTTGTTATASSVQLLVSSPQMASSGASTITLTAIALSSTRQAVPGRTISFSPGADASAYINNISNAGVTDANGQVTAQLNLGGSKANRTITVTATVDGVTATNTVGVTGTTISFSGNSSMSFGQTNPLTISVKDSAGNPIASVPVTATSQNGNTISLSPVSGITDANGLLTANVTVTVAGNDVITASAAGATQTQNLTISSANFNFTAPTPAAGSTVPQILVNTPTPITVKWTNAGAPVAGSPVTFTSTRGTVSPGTAVNTDATGTASASITSSQSGPAIITATGTTGTPSASIQVNFYTKSATMLSLQASPSTLQPTTGATGQTNNLSTITAVVRDAAYNLVQNAQVNFSIVSDPSGGSLDAPTATTDSYGTATVHYKAGAVPSPQNGVTISATVVAVAGTPLGTPLAATPPNVSLTVGGAALYVILGTDNTVGTSGTNYTKTYTALVTDSAGNPAPAGTTVTFVIRPNYYWKGSYAWNGTAWIYAAGYPIQCRNEDINYNGIIGPVTYSGVDLMGIIGPGSITPAISNDFNGNGKLDPGNVASVNATATTDANGFAIATIYYSKQYANWVTETLEATAGVVGNLPPTTTSFLLPGLATDYTTQTVSPPGQPSPFGINTSCSNPN